MLIWSGWISELWRACVLQDRRSGRAARIFAGALGGHGLGYAISLYPLHAMFRTGTACGALCAAMTRLVLTWRVVMLAANYHIFTVVDTEDTDDDENATESLAGRRRKSATRDRPVYVQCDVRH